MGSRGGSEFGVIFLPRFDQQRDQLRAARDSSPDVRLAAAEALAHLGHDAEALAVPSTALKDDSVFVRLSSLQVAARLGPQPRPLLPAIRQAKLADPQHKDISDYIGRMVDYLPERIGR